MTAFLALLRLRLQEGIAARLWLLVPAGFVVGLVAARIAAGADLAARAAAADGLLIGGVTALVVLGVAVLAATSFPVEIQTGVVNGIASTPVSRVTLFVAGALGHAVLGSVLLVGGVLAGVLGLEVGGLGQDARTPIRAFTALTAEDGANTATRDSSPASFELALTRAVAAEAHVTVRLAPRTKYEGGPFLRRDKVSVRLVGAGGETRTETVAAFAPGTPFSVQIPLGPVEPGDVVLEIARPAGALGFVFPPGSVTSGSAPRRFATSALLAALTAVPLVFLASVLASVTATRFGAPTAVIVTLSALFLHAGQDILRDSADHVLEVRTAAAEHMEEVDDHAGHDHVSGEVTALHGVLARGALLALAPVPPADAFDGGGDLASGVALRASRPLGAARAAAPAFVLLLLAGSLLIRGRELVPR